MSDLAKSLTSALTLASNNILYIFRPLHCFEVLSLGSYLAGWYPMDQKSNTRESKVWVDGLWLELGYYPLRHFEFSGVNKFSKFPFPMLPVMPYM